MQRQRNNQAACLPTRPCDGPAEFSFETRWSEAPGVQTEPRNDAAIAPHPKSLQRPEDQLAYARCHRIEAWGPASIIEPSHDEGWRHVSLAFAHSISKDDDAGVVTSDRRNETWSQFVDEIPPSRFVHDRCVD